MEGTKMRTEIFLEKRDVRKYPNNRFVYSPSEAYPEYPFCNDILAKEPNAVYDMVRHCFFGLGMDRSNYGSAAWNPLGEVIKPGETVVVKPNFVKSYDDKTQYDCTLTHPSVIRAVIDYCVIAGAGKIILGDAPIQGADMDMIVHDLHIDELLEFYRLHGIAVEFEDFRDLIVKVKNGVIVPAKEKGADATRLVTVDMKKHSRHYADDDNTTYETCGYVNEDINKHHHGATHEYVIAQRILDADVIINLPKPKTHRFAGITAAQKNFVGTCADKESLPHYKAGGKCVGGDETNESSMLSKLIAVWYRKYLWACKRKQNVRATVCNVIYSFFSMLKSEGLYTHGAWYGNDTIWRTIVDLNCIMLYADKNGQMDYSHIYRKIFTIGDMIIAGEKEGPLRPIPKPLGMIMASYNCAVFDSVFCKITGFDEALIPTIYNTRSDSRLCDAAINELQISSNCAAYDGKAIDELVFSSDCSFEPHPFWKKVLQA